MRHATKFWHKLGIKGLEPKCRAMKVLTHLILEEIGNFLKIGLYMTAILIIAALLNMNLLLMQNAAILIKEELAPPIDHLGQTLHVNIFLVAKVPGEHPVHDLVHALHMVQVQALKLV